MILYGAGGHASVILDALVSQDLVVEGIFDDNPQLNEWQGLTVLHQYTPAKYQNQKIIIAIGDNATRRVISQNISHEFGVVLHAGAYAASHSTIGVGTAILNRSVIQPGAVIGSHVIVNTGAIVEHDARVGDYAHIGPGAILCGHAEISDEVLIGAHATILPFVKIGPKAIVGAGAVVTKDVEAGAVVVGNPATKIN